MIYTIVRVLMPFLLMLYSRVLDNVWQSLPLTLVLKQQALERYLKNVDQA